MKWGILVNFFDIVFWQSFLSNLGATIIGVAIGIPVALWISRIQERNSENEKKTKILSMLRSELYHNLHRIDYKEKDKEKLKRESGVINALLKDNMWRAFSDGGELQWVKNLEVLSSLSEAYYFIGAIKYLSNKYYDSIQFATEESSRFRINEILSTLEEALDAAFDPISYAIDLIDREIGPIS